MEDKRYLKAMSEYQRHMADACAARAKAEEIAGRPRNAAHYMGKSKDYAEQSAEYEAAAT